MPKHAELLELFQQGLLNEKLPADLAINETPTFTREMRFAVYTDSYFARLSDALYDDFPVVAALLGEKRFDKMAKEYFQQHPSRWRSLADVGRDFPAFVPTHALSREIPQLPELATLEWKLVEAAYAPDSTPLDPEKFRLLELNDPRHIKFLFDPSLQLLRSTWPLGAIWRKERAMPKGQECFLAIYRDADGDGVFQELPGREFIWLRSLMSGTTLGRLSAEVEPEELDAVQEAFARFAGEGWICDVLKTI